IVGKMMLNTEKKTVALETVWGEKDFEGRKLYMMKAEGPAATVGRPGDALEKIIEERKPDIIVMIDAALKLEGEDTGSIAQGFGAAIGGMGAERFQIEEVATKHKIPIYAIVIKESIKEVITFMKKEIANTAEKVTMQLYDI